MSGVLLKAFSFVFIIFLAYFLKRIHLFGPKDYTVAVKIVLNITLPAAVVTSFAASPLDKSMLALAPVGFAANCVMMGLGSLLGRRKEPGMRALYALALPGYNIGAFAMPFAQGFLGASGAAAACLFDTGNAIMCTGGTYAVTDLLLHKRRGENPLPALLKKLCGSVPFLTYVLMLALALAEVPVPKGIVDLIKPIADANPYCAMLMIGLMFELDLRPEILKTVGLIVLLRNGAAALLSAACYFLLPLPLIARQALAVIVFAPPSALTPAFTEKCGGDPAVASCISSLCIVTALTGMICVLMLLGIA